MSSITPSSSDILLGRGGNNHKHKGNDRLRKKAEEKVLEYQPATKKKKAAMIDDITKDLLQEGVRFLNRVRPLEGSEYWQEADKVQRRGKVSQELREAVKRLRNHLGEKGNENRSLGCPLVTKIKNTVQNKCLHVGCCHKSSSSDNDFSKPLGLAKKSPCAPPRSQSARLLFFKPSRPSIKRFSSNIETRQNENEEIKQLFHEWKNEGDN